MADAMDWNPTTPPLHRIFDPYDTPLYMPGGWPQSPTNKTAGVFSRKRKHDDDTPARKRICRRVDAYCIATLNYIAQYRIVQIIRRRSRARPAVGNSTSTASSVHNNVPRTHGRSAPATIPAQQPENSTPQGISHSNSSTTTPLRRSALVDNSNLSREVATSEHRDNEVPSIAQRASVPIARAGSVLSQKRPHLGTSTMPQRRGAASKLPSTAERRRAKWSTLAYMPTTQPRLPTPEPESTTAAFSEKSHVPDIFHNMPKLHPSRVRVITPEAELMSTPPFKAPDLSPIERERESSSREDSPTTQLNNELQAVFDQQETESDAGSEEFSPAWLVTPRITPPEEASEPSDIATTSFISKPPQFVPPPVNARPVLESLLTPPQSEDRSEVQPSPPAVKFAEPGISDLTSSHVTDESSKLPDKHDTVLEVDNGTTPLKQTISVGSGSPELQLSKLSVNDEESAESQTPKAIHHSAEKLRRLTRQQKLRKKALEESLNQYELVPLTEEWDTKVRAAVNRGSGKYSASDLARVVPEYGPPGQDNWLNDEAINGYLALVTAHGKRNDRDTQTPSHHAFNSFFYSNLSTKGPDSIARWSKRAKIGGQALLDVEKVFIPINSGAHWTLAVVAPKQRTITHYNSMRSTTLGDRACRHIKQWVAHELKSDFKEAEWTIESVGESPLQTNSDDCGVFTITSARQIMLGFTPMSYQSAQIPIQRKRIVAELVNGQLLRSKEVLGE